MRMAWGAVRFRIRGGPAGSRNRPIARLFSEDKERNGSRRSNLLAQRRRPRLVRSLDTCRGDRDMNTRSRRDDFPLLVASPDLHYLDSAATSQKPKVVLDAI